MTSNVLKGDSASGAPAVEVLDAAPPSSGLQVVAADTAWERERLPDAREIAALGVLAASGNLSEALAMVETILERSRLVEVVLLHLVAPSARWLEAEWAAERRPFQEVTAGLDLLAEVVAILASARSEARTEPEPARPKLRGTSDRGRVAMHRPSRRAPGSKR